MEASTALFDKASPAEQATIGAVERVSQVSILTADPHGLIAVLADTLQLPVVWPLSDFGPFISGGVSAGNVTIVPIRYNVAGTPDTRLFSLAFDPAPLREALPKLTAAGIPHSPPLAYTDPYPATARTDLFVPIPGYSGEELWSIVLLGGLLGDELIARFLSSRIVKTLAARFAKAPKQLASIGRLRTGVEAFLGGRSPVAYLCEYHAFDARESRRRASASLAARHGGPLGLLGVREIVIGARDLNRETRRWGRLLGPATAEAGCWQVGDGPAIRLRPAAADRIESLVWDVASLAEAERFTKAAGWLARRDAGGLILDPRQFGGIEIRCQERP